MLKQIFLTLLQLKHLIILKLLLYKVQGKFPKNTALKSYLGAHEKNILVNWVLTLRKAEFPVTKMYSIIRLDTELKNKNPLRVFPFSENRPGLH